MHLEHWIEALEQRSPDCLEAEFEIVTPMFIGDGDQQARSIRSASVKGALRFWWRALNWGRCLNQQQGDTRLALNQLHREESRLFGAAAKTQEVSGVSQTVGGQGLFSLKISQQEAPKPLSGWSPSSGTQYLLGQGLWNFKTKLSRPPLQPGARFQLQLSARLPITPSEESAWQQLEQAVMAFGLLGGLGTRARKGLGSISLLRISGGRLKAPANRQEYSQTLQALFSTCELLQHFPPFSALSGYSRLDISAQGKEPLALLEQLGSEQQLYRSWGNNGKVAGQAAERNFTDDHDQAQLATQGQQPKQVPQRAVFGLPHNYFFSSTKAKVDIHVKKDAAGERRASPLLIHLHRFADGQCLAVQLLLPAVFLPGQRPQLEYKAGRTFTLDFPQQAVNWGVVAGYLDRFNARETLLASKLQGVA